MAEWVEYGSLQGPQGLKGDTGDIGPQGPQGPQGPAGADAEFPVGGTDGQSLVKDSDGYSWADMLPADGGTLTGNLAVDTDTTEPNVTVKRAVDGGSTAVEGVMRIDSDGVVGIRAKVAGAAVNNLYLEQTKTRLSKPLDVASGGVPQDGSVGQILKKGANGAEWVDSIVVDAQDAAVAMRDSAAVVDDPANPTSGIVLKTDDTGKTVISGIDGTPVDEVHVEDTTGDSTGTLAVNVDSMKAYVQDHAGDALPSGGTDGQVLTSDGAGGAAWESVPKPDMYQVLKANTYGELNKVSPTGDTINYPSLMVTSESEWLYNSDTPGGAVGMGASITGAQLMIKGTDDSGPAATFTMNSKSVTSIADAIPASPSGNALVTDKAVADYVAANAGNPFPSYGGNEGKFLRCNEEQNTVMWDSVTFSDLTGTPSFAEPSSDTHFFIKEGLGASSVKTVSMPDLQSYLGGSGGGGLELLWEGNTYGSVQVSNLQSYDLGVVSFVHGRSGFGNTLIFSITDEDGYVTQEMFGDETELIAIATNEIIFSRNDNQINAVYGLKASGGAVSNPGEVLWEGTPGYSVAVAFDPAQYGKFVVSFDGNDDETISGPFVATNGAYPSEPTENAELVYSYGAWTIRSYTNYITKIVGYK